MPKRLITNEPTFYDVDRTLIYQVHDGIWKHGDLMYKDAQWRPHKRHITQLIGSHSRGHTVVAWSAGGEAWAYKVCELLGILEYVDYTISKPRWCYDDSTSWITWIHYDSEDFSL